MQVGVVREDREGVVRGGGAGKVDVLSCAKWVKWGSDRGRPGAGNSAVQK